MLTVRSTIAGLVYPAIPDPRGGALLAVLAQLADSERWEPGRRASTQLEQLRVLLAHACEQVAWYRDKPGLSADRCSGFTWADFHSLPTLPRARVQDANEALRAASMPAAHGRVVWHSTTGSTGQPLRCASSDLTHFFNNALTLREGFWHRRDYRAKLMIIRSNAKEGSYPNWGPATEHLADTGPLVVLEVRRPLHEQLEHLRRERPAYVLTYASNAHALALHCLSIGERLTGLREMRVYGELPRPDLGALCHEAFGCAVIDLYSAEETGPIAAQCPEYGALHVHEEVVLLELLDESGAACPAGQIGRVVVTPLHNFAMPLLRYELGDYAKWGPPCACGRTLRVLASVAGRERNMLTHADGSLSWPSFPARIWLPYPAIRQVQLVQTAIDHIEVRMLLEHDLDAATRQQIGGDLGAQMRWQGHFSFHSVAQIERHASSPASHTTMA